MNKRVVLLFLAFLPLAAGGQEIQSGSNRIPELGTISLTANASSEDASVSSKELAVASNLLRSKQYGNAQSNPAASKSSQSAKPRSEPPPRIPGSMVGYVDDAIVASQVRVRFDAGFHDNAPDRAEFFYPQCSCTNVPGAPGPSFPGASTNINFQQLYFDAEYAPIRRISIFTEVPVRWIEPQANSFIAGSFNTMENPPEVPSTQTKSGISDVRVGMKFALVASANRWVTAQLKANFPSGNGSRGLGTDHYAVEPSLLYYQRLSARWAVESQIGDWHPIGGSMGELTGTQTLANFAGDVFFYGIGPSYLLVDGERFKFAPVVELFGWHVLSGLVTPPTPFPANSICTTGGDGCSVAAGDTDIVNLKIGGRITIGGRDSVYVGYGRALTSADWYRDIIRIEYRHTF